MRRPHPAGDTSARIRTLGQRAEIVSADLSTTGPVERVVEETVGRFGRLDILVNNAGTIQRADAVDFTEEDWDAVVDTNLEIGVLPVAGGGAAHDRERRPAHH